MFSRVFNTARQILSRSPSTQGRSEDYIEAKQNQENVDTEADMVTTRSGTGTDPSVESTPRSSVKRTRAKRELDIEETPTETKRRRRSVGSKSAPAEEAEEATPTGKPKAGDAQAISIPDRTISESKSPVQSKTPSSVRRGRPKVVVTKKSTSPSNAESATSENAGEEPPTQESEFYTPGTHIASPEFVTPAMYRDTAGSPTPKPVKHSVSASAALLRKVVGKDKAPITNKAKFENEVPSSSQDSENAPISSQDSAPKKTHMRFGSEEPANASTPTASSQKVDAAESVPQNSSAEAAEAENDDDDDASDSDEAPEMVATSTAATKIKALDDDAARAQQSIHEKDQLRKQKRAERIAAEQAEKRKREELKARKLAKQQAKEILRQNKKQDAAPSSNNPDLDVDMDALPALLPDSILEAVGSQRPPTPPLVRAGKTADQIRNEKLQRHIKFLEQGEKAVKDVKRGSVNVAVLAQQNALLAPKVNRDTKQIRERWMKGRQQEKTGKKVGSKVQFRRMERKAIGGGFLRGGDD